MSGKCLRQVMNPVTDLAASVAFSRDVIGPDLIAEFDPPGLAFFDLDGVRLLLERATGAPSAGTIYLAVNEVDAEVARLRDAGVPSSANPI